jgi:hypothetical protein
MSDFFRDKEGFVAKDDQVFVLPKQYRPSETKLHATLVPGIETPVPVCRVMATGEVFKYKGASLAEVAIILVQHYDVDFKLMEGIFDGPDEG